ncbi:ankyrin repeat domain-containing protein [Wolbachia endosymbiont (group A) of Aleiodes leptofemur]|uniref:ankyrin repeat domain-containing protein n=1 Tax=Wolbachia endosymbiont (group A) of Aleiodes leptofemur TaxID=3077919 RepID=UPI0033411ED5
MLAAVNLTKGDVFKQIKGILKEKFRETYKKWEQKSFDLEHLFDVSSNNKEVNIKFALLHLSALHGYKDIVTTLLDRGANVDEKNNDGCTPLHIAAEFGHTEVVIALLDRGANVNEKNNYEWTPLHIAARNSHTEVVTVLLDKGANPLVKK